MKDLRQYLKLIGLVWGGFLILIGGIYMAVIRPQIQSQQLIEKRIQTAQTRYDRAVEAAKSENLDRLSASVDRFECRARDFLMMAEDAPNLAFEVSRLADEAALDGFSMFPKLHYAKGRRSEHSRICAKYLDINFKVNFIRFASFLNALERNRPVLFVERFSIKRPTSQDDMPKVSMELAVLLEDTQGG